MHSIISISPAAAAQPIPRMQVPVELLPVIAGDTPLARAISVLLCLKSLYKETGKFKWIAGDMRKGIPGYQAELQQAAIDCRISIDTLERRLAILEEKKLITYEHDHYKFASWDTIRDTFSLGILHFKYVKILSDPHKVLQAYFFKYPVMMCQKALATMLKYSPYLKDLLLTAVGSIRFHHIAAAQVKAFVKKIYADLGPDAQFALSCLQADPFVGTEYYKKFMGLTGRGSIAYRKRDLERRGLIQVSHRAHDIANGLYTSEKARKNNLGYCSWIGGRLQLILPDQIDFNV